MAFHPPRNIKDSLDIRIQFKPSKKTGLLLYMAEHMSERTSDFLSVELCDWSVYFRFNTGSEQHNVLKSINMADIPGSISISFYISIVTLYTQV
jgi:hypothetical protein